MNPAATGTSRRLLVLLVGLAAAVAVIDQVTKQIALGALDRHTYVPLIGEYLGFRLVFNPGAAFSMATGSTWLFTVITVIVVVVILRYARRLNSLPWAIALGMLLGGALGNLTDRFFRDPGPFRGHVVDFISYYDWFVGNVADIGIVVAALMICVLALTGREIDGTRLGRQAEDADEAEDATSEDPDAAADADADEADVADGATRAEGASEADVATDADGDGAAETHGALEAGSSTDVAAGGPAENSDDRAENPDDPAARTDASTAGDDITEPEPAVGDGTDGRAEAPAAGPSTDGPMSGDDDPFASGDATEAPSGAASASGSASPASGERLTRRELRRRRAEAEGRAGSDG
ncbi:Lipoprotein signal peptidase [Actinomycetales bacterium JB111]|nr:Lipoprotein signal peptidase [Actinomycetales bacterium JB111]